MLFHIVFCFSPHFFLSFLLIKCVSYVVLCKKNIASWLILNSQVTRVTKQIFLYDPKIVIVIIIIYKIRLIIKHKTIQMFAHIN